MSDATWHDSLSEAVDRPDLVEELARMSQATFGFVDQYSPHVVSAQWTAARLLSLIPGKRVLDLGAGVAPLPVYLARRGMFVVCVARASMQASLPLAHEASAWQFFDYGLWHENLSAYECAVEDFVPSTSFDAIYSVCLLAHLPARSRRQLLARCRDWLPA